MSLGQIISGIYLTTKLATATPDTAAIEPQVSAADSTLNNKAKTEIVVADKKIDDSKTAHFGTILTETGVLDGPASTTGNDLYEQRIRVSNDRVEVNFDYYGNKNGVGRNNVSYVKANLPKGAGVAIYDVGKFDGKDMIWWEVWKTFNVGKDGKFTVDAGQGFGEGHMPEHYLRGAFTNNHVFADVTIYNDAKSLEDGLTQVDPLTKSLYTALAIHANHAYVGFGKKKDQLVAVNGVTDFKNAGSFNYALLDVKAETWTLVSTNAVGHVDQKYFSSDMMNVVMKYFEGPTFTDMRFIQPEVRGDVVFRFNATGNQKRSEYEAKVGNNNMILPVAVGWNFVSEKGELRSGPVVEAAKKFDFSKFLPASSGFSNLSGSIELREDFNSHNTSGYLTLKYQLK